jgi:hypothetical protein
MIVFFFYAQLLAPDNDKDTSMGELPGQESVISSSHEHSRIPKITIRAVSKAAARVACSTRAPAAVSIDPTPHTYRFLAPLASSTPNRCGDTPLAYNQLPATVSHLG